MYVLQLKFYTKGLQCSFPVPHILVDFLNRSCISRVTEIKQM